MKQNHLTMVVLAAWGVLALAGCGGGGGGSTQTGQTSSGVVTGFGSVYFNGVEYTVNGGVTVDGAASSEANLQVGMVVTGTCTLDPGGTTGTCSSVSYADVVEGFVLAENVTNGVGTLNVMGLTINIDANTMFESHDPAVTSIDAIPANAVAEVSGYTAGDGTVYATRIEVKDPAVSHDLELKGVVSGLDSVAQTFTIGSLVVDYSSASTVPGNLADGLYVEVKFSAAPTQNAGTYTLAATGVEVEDDGDIGQEGAEGDDLEQEGVVNAVAQDGASITVNGQLMTISANTQFHDTTTLADYPVGTYVEVAAEFVNGEWVVKEIQVEDGHHNDLELKAQIEAVAVDGSSITVMGKTIALDANTLLHDDTGAQHHFGMANVAAVLAAGDWVEVNVSIDASSNWVATKLSRESSQTATVVLEGRVDAGGASINGIAVDVAGLTMPAVGTQVRVIGTWDAANSKLLASSIL